MILVCTCVCVGYAIGATLSTALALYLRREKPRKDKIDDDCFYW